MQMQFYIFPLIYTINFIDSIEFISKLSDKLRRNDDSMIDFES